MQLDRAAGADFIGNPAGDASDLCYGAADLIRMA